MEDEVWCLNATPSSCLDYENDSVLEIMSALAPNCGGRGAWTPRSTAWTIFFYLEISVSSMMFLLLGALCLVLLFKRHSAQRFKAKTFVAIDVSLAILGFSRFLFYLLDPYGISGLCNGHKACVVVSRLLFSLGFPSLTAAYTLVFVTLWYTAKMRLGRNCIQHWKIIVPLCFIHYVVAIVFEIMGAVGSYPFVFLMLACEALFTIWGLFVCVTFLIAGCRLIQSIKTSIRQSSVVCREKLGPAIEDEVRSNGSIIGSLKRGGDSGTISRYNVTRMKFRAKRHHKQAIRKITIITYIAAALGGVYSLLTLVQLVLAILTLFGSCPEEGSSMYYSNSDVWLMFRYVTTFIEYLLAVLLVYSINDIRPLLKWVRGCLCPHSIEDKTDNGGNKSKKKKYFTYSCEETSESSSVFQMKKKSVLASRETLQQLAQVTPPSSPTSKMMTSSNGVPKEVKQTTTTPSPVQEDETDNSPKKVIPNTDDVDSSVSVTKNDVDLHVV